MRDFDPVWIRIGSNSGRFQPIGMRSALHRNRGLVHRSKQSFARWPHPRVRQHGHARSRARGGRCANG